MDLQFDREIGEKHSDYWHVAACIISEESCMQSCLEIARSVDMLPRNDTQRQAEEPEGPVRGEPLRLVGLGHVLVTNWRPYALGRFRHLPGPRPATISYPRRALYQRHTVICA